MNTADHLKSVANSIKRMVANNDIGLLPYLRTCNKLLTESQIDHVKSLITL